MAEISVWKKSELNFIFQWQAFKQRIQECQAAQDQLNIKESPPETDRLAEISYLVSNSLWKDNPGA